MLFHYHRTTSTLHTQHKIQPCIKLWKNQSWNEKHPHPHPHTHEYTIHNTIEWPDPVTYRTVKMTIKMTVHCSVCEIKCKYIHSKTALATESTSLHLFLYDLLYCVALYWGFEVVLFLHFAFFFLFSKYTWNWN